MHDVLILLKDRVYNGLDRYPHFVAGVRGKVDETQEGFKDNQFFVTFLYVMDEDIGYRLKVLIFN